MNNNGTNRGANYGNNESIKRVQKNSALPKRKMIVQKVGGVDRPFLICVLLLLCMGTLMVFSASYPYAKEHFGDSYKFAKMQVIFALVGVFVMGFIAKFIDYHFIRRFTYPLFFAGLFLLGLVAFVGTGAKGATRWLQIGPITLQPSEIMKFSVVLLFADYADRYADKITLHDNLRDTWKRLVGFVILAIMGAGAFFLIPTKAVGVIFCLVSLGIGVTIMLPINLKKELPGIYYGVLPYVIVLGIIGVLLYLQPHLSGLIIIGGIIFCMMVIGRTHAVYLLTGIGLGGAGVYALAKYMEHASKRLDVWHDPFKFLLDGGWQPAQSLYAIGSGGLFGVGFGNSRQKHLYLPEPQNDYIFSIWCEEMGFVGALFLICVFVYFIYRGIMIGLRAPDRFSSMLVIGIIMHVGLQVILNIAVVTNSLPSTGISLPFFSYGGTSLLILLAEMGVVLSVSRMSNIEKS